MFRTALALALSACGVTEGPLLLQISDASPAAPLRAAAVEPGMSLQYQITGTVDTSVDAQLFVVDLFDTPSATIRSLHAAGRVVLAYVSVGSLERWRDDADAFPTSAVGSTLAAYPDEAWLDTRASGVRSAMAARFAYAQQQGFDGVFASTVGAYRQDSGFALDRDDELDYLQFLSESAHAAQLSLGLSGDFELSAAVSGWFDWALATGCVAADSCSELAPLRAAGLPLFDLEQDGDRSSVCQSARSQGVSVTFKRPADSAFRAGCP